jgi:3-isopropylmalate/(R)-2-methylmalate dehydratase large subunit
VEWDQAVAYWRTLHSDADAQFDRWWSCRPGHRAAGHLGTSPEMVVGVDARVPDPDKEKDANKRSAMERA